MELLFTSILLGFVLVILLSLQLLHHHYHGSTDLPPGSKGWPFIGETLEFLSTGWKGHPERFVFDRMERFSERCFRTSLFGESGVAVICGAEGNKFIFSNENKLVEAWWPAAVEKVFPSSKQTTDAKDEARKMRKMLPVFLKPEALQQYVGVMDRLARKHFEELWEGRDEVLVFPLVKRYTFWLACKIFLSLEDQNHITRFADPFNHIASGIITLPVNLPWTPFNRAIKAAKFIRKELKQVIRQRMVDLAANNATYKHDILSHMLNTPIEDVSGQERFMNEDNIADKILGMLIAGHDTASSVITFIVKYLAELPHVYDLVYKEQMDIARSKREGELLTWDDLKKMKYSWNVASEVMRLAPPLQGAFRDVMQDFSFSGFRIPKGWKVYWSANSTHRNPMYFPDPDSFDPSRFEENGPKPYTYVPFGGGPRMCPGKEYARVEILVFVHNIIKRFKWEKLIIDEKIIINPFPAPEKGLPIRIRPHEI